MRSPKRVIAASVLVLEALVLLFAALVARNLPGIEVGDGVALGGGGVLALLCLVAAGLVGRRPGIAIGWVLQLVMIATGVVVPMMFGIGVLFTALWGFGIYTGVRVEHERAVVAAAMAAREGTPPQDEQGDRQA